MEVKPGYKMTEVGVIPEDWRIVSVGQAGQVLGGKQRSPHAQGESSKYLRVANVYDGYIDCDDVFEMPFSGSEKERFLLREGDVLLNEGQSIDLVGRSAVYRGVPEDCCFQNTLLRFRACRETNVSFAQLIFQDFLKRGIFSSIALQTTSIAHLGAGRFSTLKMQLPPLPEQEAIASALSDVDALIESLEQLLAKKRNIKQGAMQELLTGKRRLPRFQIVHGYKHTEVGIIPVDWEIQELGNVLESIQLGGNYKATERQTDLPLVKMGNMGRGNILLNKLQYIEQSNTAADQDLLRVGDLLLNTRNTPELVGKVSMWRGELPVAYFNSNIMRLEFKRSKVYSNEFMNHLLNTSTFVRYLREIAIGTTSVAAIYGRDLVKLKVPLPAKAEQAAIAGVLSDMNEEISGLEEKLAKARHLKQAMMQELLTGRIRLV
mgnify:CR=1 FL=1